jgi:phenylacetate-coenzyme A ligase PaaK-like adenylate-forming protein
MGGSEPASEAKVAGIRQSGAAYVTNYSMNEAGMIGGPCADSLDPTDVHLWSDALALVPGSRVPLGGDDRFVSFSLTSLMRTAPKVLINVDIDDYGILERRRCGCLLGATGFEQHMRQMRSSAKLTGRGVTLVGSDIVHVIEEVLPATFGGTPQDYQLVEEEHEDGKTMLTLLVSPSVRLEDEGAAADVLYASLARGRAGASFSGAVLRSGNAVRVRRERPLPNERGKQPPFRVVVRK